ncbi:aspartate/glutamate racemase family protein [Marinibacterium sp. SX1]|uniref:aspartate/glutamate racemase family protein n=1 Tax=Marinibacterium sp. SX1 TaxID=3388424 RepID=UPI003D184C3A
MKIAVINPNSTVSMTLKIADAARAVAGPGVVIEGRTCAGSPASIQGPADGEAAAPHLLAELERAVADGAQAAVIACFDDTALFDARKITDIPVIGIGEAGYHAAILMGRKFSVVTTLSVSVPVLEQNLVDYGLAGHCLRVRASDVPVLDLEKPGSDARGKVSAEIARAIAEDGAGAIVLGCAGMADLAADLSRDHGVPVIDGVAAATGFARTLMGLTA